MQLLSDQSIILIGPMGAGKTAVGRELARCLECEFVDSDAEVERATGVDIGFIFDKEGEMGFRRRECKAIAELVGRANVVLATGGGAVLDPDNRRRLSGAGIVVYLAASLETQLARIGRTHRRPLLDLPDPRARLAELQRERTPIYTQMADLVLDTDGQTPREVAHELLQRLQQAEGTDADG